MVVSANTENGYIQIQGTGALKRDGENIATLEENSIYKDYTIESGKTYTYSIGEAELKASLDFEYIFLSDSERQLKIKYNPKVSSFKDIILEQKIETIGSKYPFIFRNNDIRYKEISISGLISHQMDEQNLFSLNLQFSEDTSITANNYHKERKFREEVYNWLTNGKPKLFRSPQEGNYIIQLMNVSLTPMDQLGRLLYSFNATGYEIVDYNIENMIKYHIIRG